MHSEKEGSVSQLLKGGTVAGSWSRQSIEPLETSFGAASYRDIDGALVLSARDQVSRRLIDRLHEGAWELNLGDGSRLPVTLVGRDFVGAGSPSSILVPSARAVLIQATDANPPQRSDATLTEELRGLAGLQAHVRVETEFGSLEGLLARVGSDHLLLRAGEREMLLGLAGISVVELIRQTGTS